MKVLNLFKSSAHIDEEEKRRNYLFIRVILIASIIVLPILIILKFSSQTRLWINDYILFFLLFVLTIFLLILKKNVLLISILSVLVSWISMTTIALAAEGVHNVTIIAYLLIIFIAALIIGYKMALLMTALSIISVWILAFLEINNHIDASIDSPIFFSRDYTIITVMVITLIILYQRRFQNWYARMNQELQERKNAEEKLIQNEIRLKEQNEEYLSLNEELTESNNRIKSMNTDLKVAKEKAEESDRLKTAFLNNISHEIRTPLNGIIGFNELLRNTETSELEKFEYIDFIKTSSFNLAKLMNDIMDISRLDAGVIDIHISRFKLNELFKELELNYSKLAEEKGLDLSFINDLNNNKIETDKERLIQILNNLISNALKFTLSGFIRVHAKQFESNIVISVFDSGIGIKKEKLEIIFDRFTQADMDLTRIHGGTGLGLSIAKGLVEYLGGEINVRSEYGKGSEFTFKIPVLFSSDEQKEHPIIKVTDTLFAKRINILIAEDEDINFFYLRECLKYRNCDVVRAHNGKEAIDKVLENQNFDIILMDIRMPVMNGYDASRKIKEINKLIPIIAVTAFANKEDKEHLPDIHFDDYLAKPITADNLFNRINSLLKTVISKNFD